MESKEHFIEEIDLQRYWLVLKRRWLPASGVLLASLAVALFSAASQEPVYVAYGKLHLRTDRTPSLTGIGESLGDLQSLTADGNPLDTQAEMVTSLPILEDTIRTLNLRDEAGELVDPKDIREGITVEADEDTDILHIAYESGQPELSAAVVNQVMQSYIAYNIQTNRAEVRAARQFLERELPKSEQEVQRLSKTLQRFNENNRIVDLDAEASVTVNAIANIDSQIRDSQTRLVELESRVSELKKQLNIPLEDALTLTALSQSESVQKIFDQWQTLQTELASARTRYTAQHPTVRALERQEASLKTLLQQRIREVAGASLPVSSGTLQLPPLKQNLAEALVQAEIDRIGAFNQLASLTSTRDAYVNWADVFPKLETTQLDLQQQLSHARNTYETLLQRLQEVRLTENQKMGSARVLETASIPSEAMITGTDAYLQLGGIVGLFLGIAVAFFLDLIDRSIKTVKDAERVFNCTTLGLIPYFEVKTSAHAPDLTLEGLPSPRIVTPQSLYPMISGSYQMLQANLRFISSDTKIQSIVVSSSIAGEGKSEVCANLAASIAQTDRRVLLIDADMRTPRQHHLWNVINAIGLSHVLVGEGRVKDAVLPINENLFLMTAGVVPPNPLALLDSERMAALIALFSKRFDYIILDTPPLAGTADAAVIGNLANGILMVMRPRLVTYDSALAANKLLTRSGATLLGLVANGVDMKTESSEYTYNAQVSGQYTSSPMGDQPRVAMSATTRAKR
jgi:capsular exopolysaccharide synthesis family protein